MSPIERPVPPPLRVWRSLRARPRLFGGFAVALAVALILPANLPLSTRALVGWDCGTLVYLAATLRMMLVADTGDIRVHAQGQDEGRAAILLLTSLAIAVSFGAIAAELHGMGDDKVSGSRLALAGLTILLSWTMTQVVMAVHYAGEYYGDPAAEGGMAFPGATPSPTIPTSSTSPSPWARRRRPPTSR